MPKKHPSPSGEVIRTRRRARGQHATHTPADDGAIIFFTQAEVRALLAATKQQQKLRDQAIILLAYRHGLRAGEVGMLFRTDYQRGVSKLTIHREKDSRSGTHLMQLDETRLLNRYLATRDDDAPYLFTSNRKTAIGRGMLWHLMQVYGELASVPWAKRNFHALRHATAPHMLMAGIDVRSVQDWMGPSASRTRYATPTLLTRIVSRRRARWVRASISCDKTNGRFDTTNDSPISTL